MSYFEQWKAYGLDCLHRDQGSSSRLRILSQDDATITLSSSFVLTTSHSALHPLRIPCEFIYTIHLNGHITVTTHVDLPHDMPPPPRIGLRTILSSAVGQHVNWFGYGPHEAYDDRKSCVALGFYSKSIEQLHVPYVVPQESGRRHDPRWIELVDTNRDLKKTKGLRIIIDRREDQTPDSPLSWGWSMSRYSLETLESTRHNHELEEDHHQGIHLHVDRAMMGLGGYDSWSPNVDSKYLIATGCRWKFSMTFAPFER